MTVKTQEKLVLLLGPTGTSAVNINGTIFTMILELKMQPN